MLPDRQNNSKPLLSLLRQFILQHTCNILSEIVIVHLKQMTTVCLQRNELSLALNSAPRVTLILNCPRSSTADHSEVFVS